MSREGEILNDEFEYNVGRRGQRCYMLLDSEMETLLWAPRFLRRRIIERVRAETSFDDEQQAATPAKDEESHG